MVHSQEMAPNPRRRRRHYPALLRFFALGVLAFIVAAGSFASLWIGQASASSDVEGQFWPEVDLYHKLSDYARLYGIATYTLSEESTSDNEQYGLNVDIFAKPPKVLPLVRGADALAMLHYQPVQLRLGYRYSRSLDAPPASVQNRLLAELTLRGSPPAFSLADRNAIDARWIDGEYSTRYRNRILLEVPVEQERYGFTPYANAEWFYSITKNQWTSVRYELGIQVPVVSHVSVEPYVAYQTYWHSSDPSAAGPGLNCVVSW